MTGPQRPESREPGTEAGRALLAEPNAPLFWNDEHGGRASLLDTVLEIEAEARAAERTETEPCYRCGYDASRYPARAAERTESAESAVLRAMLRSVHIGEPEQPLHADCDVCRALAADPRPPELDVERLARALDAVDINAIGLNGWPPMLARQIAAEYARLAADPRPRPEE